MNLRQLHYFIQIVEEGSFSRASQMLHIAQPALSHQLANLEKELGVKLLLRSVRGVVPTAAGLVVLRQAHLILKQIETTKLIASEAENGVAGVVAIGLPWTVSTRVGLPLLKELSKTAPGIKVEIIEGPSSFLANLLVRGKLDIAVVFDDSTDGGLVMNKVATEPMLWIGPKGKLPKLDTVDVLRPLVEPLLLVSRPNGVRETLERIFAKHNVTPSVVAEINSPLLLLKAVHEGLGHSILPLSAVMAAENAGEVDAIRIDDDRVVRHVYLCTSKVETLTAAADHTYRLLELLMRDFFSNQTKQCMTTGN